MSYSSEIDDLELFTAPFRNPQAYMAAPASHLQQSKTAATRPKAAVSPTQQPKAASQPPIVKPKVPVTQPQKPDVSKKSVSDVFCQEFFLKKIVKIPHFHLGNSPD